MTGRLLDEKTIEEKAPGIFRYTDNGHILPIETLCLLIAQQNLTRKETAQEIFKELENYSITEGGIVQLPRQRTIRLWDIEWQALRERWCKNG